MYQSILKPLLIAVSFLFINLSFSQKVGHLNFQDIITVMPEYKVASNEYELYQASLEDELKNFQAEYVAAEKKLELESKKAQPSQIRLKSLQQQMMTIQQDYQEYAQSMEDSLKAKMAELVAPIKKKVEEAVAEVAKELGYSHVIDNSYGTLLYADDQFNLEKAVKDKLNIKDKPNVTPKTVGPRPMPNR
ncbi:MAG: OmpH family outer membrane protein [Candidatus Paceibacterota bacterium]